MSAAKMKVYEEREGAKVSETRPTVMPYLDFFMMNDENRHGNVKNTPGSQTDREVCILDESWCC